jgi:transposase-like protein
MSDDNTPKTLLEAVRYFSDPDVCLQFVAGLRWQDGATCPHCESKELSFLKTRRIWKCKTCKKQFSVKVGTIFEDSPIGLDKWLCAIWMIANAKNGISSYEVSRAIGVTQKSAWFMMHRIRLAMETGSFAKLSGEIEVDETWIGGKYQNMHKSRKPKKGEDKDNKTIVLGFRQRGGEVRTKVSPDTSRFTLDGQVHLNVEAGATVYTDTHPGYARLGLDYVHSKIDHAKEYAVGGNHINGMENFWGLVKRCIKGTYTHVDDAHVARYLEEQTFRYNNRLITDKGRFKQAVGQIAGKRITYKELTKK